MRTGLRVAALALAAVGSAVTLAGCSGSGGGGGILSSNQVVVRLDDASVAHATQVAQQTCAYRGGNARLVAVVSGGDGGSGRFGPADVRVPDAVFACDPAR
jgi:hypothetical protein